MTSYIYTFIRRDLSTEQRIVQLGHAAYEAGKRFRDDLGISNLILLNADDENELSSIARKLDTRGIEYEMFYEPDYNTGFTAICCKPVTTEDERAFFSKWKLYREHVDVAMNWE